MEWVETTAKTIVEAEERVLDQLGVARDEAEFEVLEEPKSGLFGLLRGEARIRGRVRPTAVRPKQDRRRQRGRKSNGSSGNTGDGADGTEQDHSSSGSEGSSRGDRRNKKSSDRSKSDKKSKQSNGSNAAARSNNSRQDTSVSSTKEQDVEVSPQEVGDAAVSFMDGLIAAFGTTGTTELSVDDNELEVTVTGDELGLLVGPGGRTLNSIQDLARVAAQRRLGDHETRLRVDVGGYRAKRRVALEEFTRKVAAQVTESGSAKALEPMASADRKVVHDTVNTIDGVESRSDGDDPARRVVIAPA